MYSVEPQEFFCLFSWVAGGFALDTVALGCSPVYQQPLTGIVVVGTILLIKDS